MEYNLFDLLDMIFVAFTDFNYIILHYINT